MWINATAFPCVTDRKWLFIWAFRSSPTREKHVTHAQGSLAETIAVANPGSEVAVADKSREPGANVDSMKNDAAGEVKFPRCDAAVRKRDGSEWDLADAILAECCEPGEDGVRNESHAKMKAMRQEIATNHGFELSFERIRKLRKVASAFPPGRRRPAVSLEGHLEAGTPEALDEFIKAAPNGTPMTREYIRRLKHPAEKVEQDRQRAERRHQIKDQRTALQNVCRQLEREKEEREQRYTDLCRSVGKEPEPFSPPPSPETEPPLTVARDLEQGLRVLLMARGFDPKADNMKRAIDEFVRAVLPEQE
jgi:hypothetical protein